MGHLRLLDMIKMLLLTAGILGVGGLIFGAEKKIVYSDETNPVFIVVWVSTSPIIENGSHIGDLMEDRISYRSTMWEAEEWIKILKNRAKGFGFKIYESYLIKKEANP